MVKLTRLLLEALNKPKAIIMAGGSSVGKSVVINSIKSLTKNFVNINADNYVEDKNSPMYGNLSAAASQIRKKDLPNAVNKSKNIIYDTTSSNLNTSQPIIDDLKSSNYDIMMIMVYAHPIVAFLRNFKRERKVPAVGILGTWASAYSLIDDYKRIFGNNFVMVDSPASTPEEFKEIDNFTKAYHTGKLREYFANLLSTGGFTSSFRKDDTNLSPEDMAKREKQREKTKEMLEKNIDKIADTYEDIQSKLNLINIKDLPNIVNNFIK